MLVLIAVLIIDRIWSYFWCKSGKKLCVLFVLGLLSIQMHGQQDRVFALQNKASIRMVVDTILTEDAQLEIFKSHVTISGLAFSGDLVLHADSSLIRMILVDERSNEYLIYEAYPILAGSNQFSIADIAEETSSLNQVIPNRVNVEFVDASIHLKEIIVSEGSDTPNKTNSQSLQQQSLDKIRRINENIQERGQLWVAGETAISRLSYQEKLSMFGGSIPNFQGLEYYVGGVFVLPATKQGDLNLNATKSLTTSPA